MTSHQKPEEWQPKFLKALREEMSVVNAAAVANISRKTAYKYRKSDEAFRMAWDDVIESNVDDLEASAFKRATEGWLEPVYYRGKVVGAQRKYDTALTIFLLKCWRRERYGHGVDGHGIDPMALMAERYAEIRKTNGQEERDAG